MEGDLKKESSKKIKTFKQKKMKETLIRSAAQITSNLLMAKQFAEAHKIRGSVYIEVDLSPSDLDHVLDEISKEMPVGVSRWKHIFHVAPNFEFKVLCK